MRKLLSTSVLMICMTCPSFADIAAGTSSTSCDYSVLNSYTGPVGFSSVYRPAIGSISLVDNRYASNDGSGVQSADSHVSPGTLYSVYGTGVYFTQPTPQTVSNYTTSNRATNLTTIPTMTGYSFQGFYTTKATGGDRLILADGSMVYDGISNMIDDDSDTLSLYARWTPNTYTIAYSLTYTGAPTWTNDTTHPTSATYDEAFNVINPTRTGYTFNGWNILGMDTTTHYRGTTSTPATSFSTATASDITDTYFKNLRATSGTVTFAANNASWTAKQYDVTYNKGSHAGNNVNNYVHTDGATYDQNYTIPAAAAAAGTAATGYTFRGWSTNENDAWVNNALTDEFTGATPWQRDSDLTVFAIYSANTHSITYDCGVVPTGATTGTPGATVNGLAPSAVAAQAYDAAWVLSATAGTCNLSGYHFGGWRCSYNLAEGTENTVTQQNTVNTPNYVSSYTNNVWSVSASGNEYKVDANVTCSATWAANSIDLNWYQDTITNGATTPFTTSSCTYDNTFNLPTNYSPKNGYHYNGWTVRVPEIPNCPELVGTECGSTEGCVKVTSESCRNLVPSCESITTQSECETSGVINSAMQCVCSWSNGACGSRSCEPVMM